MCILLIMLSLLLSVFITQGQKMMGRKVIFSLTCLKPMIEWSGCF
ncbi:hypothetical protein GLYMA_11G146201v4 [Glycine max]|nr:hypothetical protein GLYMA_11G146201v4 [Glycine max]KAH1159466.1 hypothetical protein GYH30_031263 [Glycine max]